MLNCYGDDFASQTGNLNASFSKLLIDIPMLLQSVCASHSEPVIFARKLHYLCDECLNQNFKCPDLNIYRIIS